MGRKDPKILSYRSGRDHWSCCSILGTFWQKNPAIYFTEEAQRFIIDNIDAVIATSVKKKKDLAEALENNDEEGI